MNGVDDLATIKKYVAENNFTFRIGLAEQKGAVTYDIAELYGVQAYPTNYLIDQNGKVLWRSVGFDEDGLRSALKKAGL